jgi:CubicO group peptidase (beta-lactamase class C family)
MAKRSNPGAILFLLISAMFSPIPGSAVAQEVSAPSAVSLDDFIRSEMQKRQIQGLSLAIIQDGKIVKAKGYGVVEKGKEEPVTTSTLFQAGSISKPVSALGALILVEQGKLALDEDVNVRLTSWKVPENEFTKEKKVTLRGLLSHTAGLTVHGFPGYAVDGPIPTVVQILDGEKPANTAPIRVDFLPGSKWRYSGGGYTIMQQLLIDVAGRPFPEILRDSVLTPLGMLESSFQQPQPPDRAKLTASGYYQDRRPVPGRWHIYPEMAAAGLWTTPSDLARFAIGIQEAYTGKSDRTISKAMAHQMLAEVKNTYGLGVGVHGIGSMLRFGHGGRDEGFDADLEAYAETGQGAAIMINANDNSRMIPRIMDAIAREYHWPNFSTVTQPNRRRVEVGEETLVARSGRYEFANNQMMTLVAGPGRLQTLVDGLPDEEFLPESEDRFFSAQRDAVATFLKGDNGQFDGFLWKENGRERKVPKIGPLFRSLEAQADPDPSRSEKVLEALKALHQGGKATADSPLITDGAKADFGPGGGSRDLKGLRSIRFVAEQDVSGRKIERHQGEVARVLHYRLLTDGADKGILVHLTPSGLITDFDVVED